MKKCSKCGNDKSLELFGKNKSNKDGLHHHCKECRKNYHTKWYKEYGDEQKLRNSIYRANNKEKVKQANHKYKENNYEKIKNKELMNSRGITLEVYNRMLEDQNYSCAICKTPESELRIRLAVDHNHVTGEIRGLLCNRCNLSLGVLETNDFITKALEYLKLPQRFWRSDIQAPAQEITNASKGN